MTHWARRAVQSALLNGIIWLTPPPIHLIALAMPVVSGYSIGLNSRPNLPLGWLVVGLIMALTLGSLVLTVGILSLLAAKIIFGNLSGIYTVVVLILAGSIGGHTGIAASIGAMYGMRKTRPDSGSRIARNR